MNLLTTLGTCRFILADFAAGEEILATSALTALDLRDPVSACRAYHNVAFGVDDLSRMAAYAEAGLAVARDAFVRPYERSFLIALAACATGAGRLRARRGALRRGRGRDRPLGRAAHIRLDVGLPRALLALARGDADDARAQLSAVLERLRTAHELGEWAAQRGLALALLAAGETAGARDALAPALGALRPGELRPHPGAAHRRRGGGGRGVRAEARRLAGELARIAPDHPRTTFSAAWRTRRAERRAPPPRSSRRRARGRRRAARGGGPVAPGRRERPVGRRRRRRGGARDTGARRQPGHGRRRVVAAGRAGASPPGRAGAEPAQRRGAGGLTAREVQVLGLVADGLSNRAIAERLFISQKTAGRHVSNLFAKLGVHSRAQAARVALERGLLGDATPGRRWGVRPMAPRPPRPRFAADGARSVHRAKEDDHVGGARHLPGRGLGGVPSPPPALARPARRGPSGIAGKRPAAAAYEGARSSSASPGGLAARLRLGGGLMMPRGPDRAWLEPTRVLELAVQPGSARVAVPPAGPAAEAVARGLAVELPEEGDVVAVVARVGQVGAPAPSGGGEAVEAPRPGVVEGQVARQRPLSRSTIPFAASPAASAPGARRRMRCSARRVRGRGREVR